MSNVFSRKSTPMKDKINMRFITRILPMVASVFSGNFPEQNRYVKHVLPKIKQSVCQRIFVNNLNTPTNM